VIDDLSGVELDMALGRDHVIHAALVAGAGTAGDRADPIRFVSTTGLRGAGPQRSPIFLDSVRERRVDMALGRDHVIHAALVAGAGTAGLLARWRRLHVFLRRPSALASLACTKALTPVSLSTALSTLVKPVTMQPG
jgi:hypothetical protein